jgi:hypothetical protein
MQRQRMSTASQRELYNRSPTPPSAAAATVVDDAAKTPVLESPTAAAASMDDDIEQSQVPMHHVHLLSGKRHASWCQVYGLNPETNRPPTPPPKTPQLPSWLQDFADRVHARGTPEHERLVSACLYMLEWASK